MKVWMFIVLLFVLITIYIVIALTIITKTNYRKDTKNSESENNTFNTREEEVHYL